MSDSTTNTIPLTRDTPPRVSILIPNYNNGRASSRDGQIDLIGNLCQSLWDTLVDEQTPFEIIAYDDGSTDDSLQTLRDWSQRTWPTESGGRGRPFLELIEAEHCGVLAKTANILTSKAKGEFIARLDGDTICLTPNWVTELCAVFDNAPDRLAVVGPKQLLPTMKVHALGDWVIHPKGYHHIASGLHRDAVHAAVECDHVMGCFYCHRKSVFEELGGYDEDFLRGQTVDFGMRVRLAGYSCIAVPQIEFIHAHCDRKKRPTSADTQDGVMQSLNTFTAKWGFNRIAPDLDYIREKYAGTGLMWNAAVFAGDPDAWPADPVPNPDGQPLDINDSEWTRYANDPRFRHFIDTRVAATRDVISQLNDKPKRIGLVGAGTGLIPHILANVGILTTASDRHQANLDLARACVRNQQYSATAGRPPTFIHQPGKRLPFDDQSLEMLLLFDQLEKHPNPAGLLAEIHRVLHPERTVIIAAPATPQTDDQSRNEHRFGERQLFAFLHLQGGFMTVSEPTFATGEQPIIIVAKRIEQPAPKVNHPPVLNQSHAAQPRATTAA